MRLAYQAFARGVGILDAETATRARRSSGGGRIGIRS